MSQEQSATTRSRGRPPSRAARRRALQAAYDILMEEGFGRLTMEAVAARSGVGKPTIYRNWSNAIELAMAALMAGKPMEAKDDERDLEAALRAQLRALVQAFASTRGRQIAMTLAAADPESEMTKAFRNQVILSSREEGRRLLEQAAAGGGIGKPENIEVLLDMIYGPLFYRLLVRHQPLDIAFADALVSRTMKLLEPKSPDDGNV
ncbi:TetR/AcrR family transcriptional regulator [Roseibium salinum]|uniref:TetR/AcrR family transcriptional regulator n=1 Tax=Roseibium salinum TaxID=1604349 RepID=A0ABT3QYL8_9HYPH|nr:TetR/AcrR family transcriptional regulator [Roseibium sp. DSM 29163]MCX2722043.1 TetR/AcrR family transcriptional regulator [Roseibium sp. DSM 29163]